MTILRKTLAVLGGILSGGLVITAVEAIGHSFARGEAVFGVAITGYGIGTAAGSFVAARFGDRVCSMIVTSALAILAAINFFAFPHPLWFAPTAVIIMLLGWALGAQFAGVRGIKSGETQ